MRDVGLTERRPVDRTVGDDLDDDILNRAYQRWAPFYDLVWGAVLERGRLAAVQAARAVGGRILEIGIGTGLSIPHYRDADMELYGIDLCDGMLAKARQRAQVGQYPFVKQLTVMDAHHLGFENGFFDCAVAQFMITLVARPEQVLSECARIVRPGGEVVLVSHFYSEQGLTAQVERRAASHLRSLGLQPAFPISRLVRWASQDGRLNLIECKKTGLFGSNTLVRFRRG